MPERILLVLAALLLVAALWRWRRPLTIAAAVLVGGCALDLTARFLLDDFSLHYVWLYSSPPLAWYLKLAGLWSGEQGTLLLLAALAAGSAALLARRQGWAGPGAILTALMFIGGTLWWDPFVATPAADLAKGPRGLNIHLQRVWMAFHPPFIFVASMAFLAPWAAAAQALANGGGDWPRIAAVWTRAGWFVLSLGLGTGMWWAYEDFTFGQFWHWDPVQTAIFIVWALSTAHLHLLRNYRPTMHYDRLHPLLGLVTAVAVLGSMVVTRDPSLASSHRYVGDTSLPLLLWATGGLLAVTVLAWAWSLRRGLPRKWSLTPTLTLAALALVACAGAAGWHLAEAYWGEFNHLPRPAELKPFFETLTRWAPSSELAALRAAFAQWEVNPYAVNRTIAPVVAVLGMVGTYHFLPLRTRWLRWTLVLGASALLAVLLMQDSLFARLYTGNGMTSGRTVSNFHGLDAMVAALVLLALTTAWWAIDRMRRQGFRRQAFSGPFMLGLIHVGIVIALGGFLAATVLDSYAQRMLAYPSDFGKPQAFADGYTVTLDLTNEHLTEDGFFLAANVHLLLADQDSTLLDLNGHTVFRDARPPTLEGQGPVRLMCEILDYRYARFSTGKRRMMDPVIHRGLWRDVQVWMPAPEYPEPSQPGDKPQESMVPVVIKTFPLASWVWIGLLIAGIGAAVWGWRQVRMQG